MPDLDETSQLDAASTPRLFILKMKDGPTKHFLKNHPGGVSLSTYRTKAKAQEVADKQNEQIIAAIGKDRKDTPRFHVVSPIGFYSTVEKALEPSKQERYEGSSSKLLITELSKPNLIGWDLTSYLKNLLNQIFKLD